MMLSNEIDKCIIQAGRLDLFRKASPIAVTRPCALFGVCCIDVPTTRESDGELA